MFKLQLTGPSRTVLWSTAYHRWSYCTAYSLRIWKSSMHLAAVHRFWSNSVGFPNCKWTPLAALAIFVPNRQKPRPAHAESPRHDENVSWRRASSVIWTTTCVEFHATVRFEPPAQSPRYAVICPVFPTLFVVCIYRLICSSSWWYLFWRRRSARGWHPWWDHCVANLRSWAAQALPELQNSQQSAKL